MSKNRIHNSALSRRGLVAGAAVTAVSGLSVLAASGARSGDTTYQYDALGRVINVAYPDGAQISYQYDHAGNRILVTKVAGSGSSSSSSSSSSSGGGGTIIQVTGASNLRTLANAAGYTGASPGNYQFNVASGVTVIGAAGGGKGIDTGTWPSGSTLSLVVSGNVYGGGGNGGAGSNSGAGSAGSAGGDAVYVQASITVTINAGGTVQSGGGGGGGGGYATGSGTVGGDGGGGGFPNGSGGAGSSGTVHDTAVAGAPGTTSGGGAGGSSGPPGGGGGNAGMAGANGTSGVGAGGTGGAAGYAIRKNGNTVTYSNSGTINGSVG